METTRLHPLLTAAAISVTVFSAAGVAAITGLLPNSIGSAKDTPVLEVPQEVAKPIAPAIAHPVPAPAPKPVKKAVVRKPAEPVVYRDFPETYPVAQAPVAKPVVQPGHVGTVQGVR